MASSQRNPIILYRGFPDKGRQVWSPFVVKLELRLRLAGLPYTTEAGSPRSGPTGKIPYVDVAPLNNASAPDFIGDSALIAQSLAAAGHIRDLNASLSPRDRAADTGIRALCEDKLYFFGTRERWLDPANFYVQRDKVLAALPWPVRVVVGLLIYRANAAGMQVQGVGRYSQREYEALRAEIWNTLADALAAARTPGNKPFWVMGGAEPTEADCAVFGFVVSALLADSGPATREIVKGLPVLVEYATRINAVYFPDYEDLI